MRGANLPIGMTFPCTLNLDHAYIFIIGHPWGKSNQSEPKAFLYNERNKNWTILSEYFPCIKQQEESEFSCAYLRPQNSVVTAIDNCVAILNLTSLEWNMMSLPFLNGFVFNGDLAMESLYFIGSNISMSGSEIFQVKIMNQGVQNLKKM